MTRLNRRSLLAIVLIAISLRVCAVFLLQSHRVPRSTYEHGEIAANLLAGRGFAIKFLGAEGPTSQQAPAYPLLVAAAYAIAGTETPAALLLLQIAQSLIGGLLVFVTFGLARWIAPGKLLVGLAAALIVALHPTLIYAATHVQVALLGATLVCGFLQLSFRAGSVGTARSAAVAGVVLALTALTDPILSLAVVGGGWAIALGRSSSPRAGADTLRLVGILCLTAAVGVAPWIIRNACVHGEFVAIKSTFGYAFWQGNCALSEGTDKVVRPSVETILEREGIGTGLAGLNRTLWKARHEAGYIDDIALGKDDVRRLGTLSEPERSRVLFARAIKDLQVRPGRYVSLCLRRLRYFWLFDESNPKTRSWIYRSSHLGLTAMAGIGLLLAPATLRRRLAPTLAVAALISLFHTLTIVSARFHIPIEPLMAIWAASGLASWPHPGSSSAPRGHDIVSVGLISRLHRKRVGLAGRLP